MERTIYIDKSRRIARRAVNQYKSQQSNAVMEIGEMQEPQQQPRQYRQSTRHMEQHPLAFKYKPVIDQMLAEHRDKPFDRGMAFKLHMQLVLYGTKNFPELTQAEINKQAQAIVTAIAKKYRETPIMKFVRWILVLLFWLLTALVTPPFFTWELTWLEQFRFGVLFLGPVFIANVLFIFVLFAVSGRFIGVRYFSSKK